jgi:ornithine carbamoyltransferase
MHFICCCPSEFEPDSKTIAMVDNSTESTVELSHDPSSAVDGADVVYTDVWASMGQKDEAEEREKLFADFQVNENLMEKTGKDSLFLHCLPAERGREVSDGVMEASYSVVFDEAENRMHVQNAIMVSLNTFK